MANFSRSEITRRKDRLERRLKFLQGRIDRDGLAEGSHDSAECSALQTALVLFDEELERVEARELLPCEHENYGPGPWVGADRTWFCHRCPAWCIVGQLGCNEWRMTPRPEQNGRAQVPTADGEERPPKVPPPIAFALFSVPGVRAWDLHWTERGLGARVFVDERADVEAVGKVLHAFLPAYVCTHGEVETIVLDAEERPRTVRFTQLREPWTFRHIPPPLAEVCL